jgi:hypothetical protein
VISGLARLYRAAAKLPKETVLGAAEKQIEELVEMLTEATDTLEHVHRVLVADPRLHTHFVRPVEVEKMGKESRRYKDALTKIKTNKGERNEQDQRRGDGDGS